MVCVNVRSHPRTPTCPRLHPLAHCAHFARVRVCGCAKFRTFALLHTFFSKFSKSTLHTRLARTSHTFRTRAGVRNFARSHFCTHFCNFFQKNISGHNCTHIAHISHACGCAKCAKFFTFTLLHTFLHMIAHKLPKRICIHIEHITHVWKCLNFAHLHTFLQFTLLMSKDFRLQPQAHRTYFPHLLVCKCVNVRVRNIAHPHILKTFSKQGVLVATTGT